MKFARTLPSSILVCIATAPHAIVVAEQSDDVKAAAKAEEAITVVATRTERNIDEVAAMISVKSSEEIEEELVRSIADLVRYEPGVTVQGTGSRFGLTGFSIRGIGGNRVLTVIDGVRVPDEFSFGPFLSARRDYVDVDSVSRVEIARGPVSSLYGSDALGGVVAFSSKSPRQVINAGSDIFTSLKVGYSSADSSDIATVTVGAQSDALSGVLVYSKRSGAESKNFGETSGYGVARELPDPRDISTDNLTAELSWQLADDHNVTFDVENYANEASTMIYSDYGSVVYGTVINTRDASDTRDRTRLSLGYGFEGDHPLSDSVQVKVFWQESETEQKTHENRLSRRGAQTRDRNSFFDQQYQGFTVQLEKLIAGTSATHHLVYGFERYSTDSSALRDGATYDAAGMKLREFTILPTRDFPETHVTKAAFYVQNEIGLFDGRVMISPSLRFDSFDADAIPDSIYLNGNPGQGEPVDFSDSELSARIGLVTFLSDEISLFANYSEGFRAPPTMTSM